MKSKKPKADADPTDAFLLADILGEQAAATRGSSTQEIEALPITPGAYRRTAVKRQYKNLLRVAAAEARIDTLPEAGESIHLVVAGDYRPWDLIPAMLNLKHPHPMRTLYVATLSYSRDNVDDLCHLRTSGAAAAVALVTSVYDQAKDPARFAYAFDAFKRAGIRMVAFRNHCKIIAAEFDDGTTYVCEGSANIRSCLSSEQIVLTSDRGLYQFHAAWMEEALTTP